MPAATTTPNPAGIAADRGDADATALERLTRADGHEVQACLLSLDWSLAAHISAPGELPWIFISTYAPADPRGRDYSDVFLIGAEVASRPPRRPHRPTGGGS